MLRVFILIALASMIWVPIGVWVGMRPRAAQIVQPIAQFMAAFPANLLFPIAVYGIVAWKLDPDIYLSPLMILGTQWYILFNVIAGASAIPAEMRYVAANFGISGWLWWRKVALPAVLPFYVTGAITASGGSWNAAIVAELASWGNTQVQAQGLGSYIAEATKAGDFHRIVLGIGDDEPVRRHHQSAVLAALVLLRRAQISTDLTELPMNNSPLLQCTDVRKAFPKPDGAELLVLEGMNLELREGQIVGLLGRSGSGKSTLLRLIAGLAEPTAGHLRYMGQPISGPASGIAMVFQSFALFPWLTVFENVALGLEAQRMPRADIRKRSLAAIDLIGLDGFESAYPRELSGGMRQRVGFARALVVHPNILLMDEPFSALDVLTAETLRTDFLDLWAEGRMPIKGVILVTHNIEEAVLMCDRP